MVISRRSFLFSSAAFAAAPYLRTFAAEAVPRLRMGILSDIHVRGRDWTLEPFVQALKWFDAQKVDGVVIAGDLADFGMLDQLKVVGETWDSFFPDGKARDGRPVERVFVTGNHDYNFYNHPRMKKMYPDEKERFDRSIAKDFNAAWTACFHEPYRPISVKTVKGYPFVMRHYREEGLAAFMEKVKFDPKKPFFYVYHCHPKGTCYGPESDKAADKGDTKRVLSAFPNCIALTGHTHYPLTDPDILWRGEFASLGCGSLLYAGIRDGKGGDRGDYTIHHGMLMDVYDDRVVFVRRNFAPKAVETLGEDLIVRIRT